MKATRNHRGIRDFLALIRNYQGLKELDATVINALIDKILVSEREKLTDGMVRQEIKIYYKIHRLLSVNYISHRQSGGLR